MTSTSQATAKSPVLTSPVIVCNSWGNYHVYPATIEYARRLLNDALNAYGVVHVPGLKLLQSREALKANPDDSSLPYLVGHAIIARAFKDVLSLESGTESRSLYRLLTVGPLEKDAKLPITKAIQDELVLWAFKQKVDAKELSAHQLNKTQPHTELSFMAGLVSRAKDHQIQYCDSADLDEAEELQVLLYGQWKESANV